MCMLKKRVKIPAAVIIILIASFFSIRYYIYNGGKRDIQAEKSAFTVVSNDIITEFTSNVDSANKKYLEKTIAVTGIVTSINNKEVIIDKSVNCMLLVADNSIKSGQKVTVKGRVVGYDDIFGEVKLDQCNLTNNK